MNLWAGFNQMNKTDIDELLESCDDMPTDEFQPAQKQPSLIKTDGDNKEDDNERMNDRL